MDDCRRHRCARTALAGGVAALLMLAACPRATPLPTDIQQRLTRVAIVARTTGVPVSYLGRGDPAASGAILGTDPAQVDARLETEIGGAFTHFELEALVQNAIDAGLGEPRPFQVVPFLQVASQMGTLLAREASPDYRRLQGLGVNGVFDVEVVRWGLWDDGPAAPAAGWMGVRVKLIEVPSMKELWQRELEVNLSRAPRAETAVDLAQLAVLPRETIRFALGEAIADIGREVATQIGGSPPPRLTAPPAEESPEEIEEDDPPPPDETDDPAGVGDESNEPPAE